MSALPNPRAVSDPDALAEALDAATHEERLAWLLKLGGRQQRHLFALCRGRAVSVTELAGAEGEIVRYPGRNGLPFFSRFEKRLYRSGSEVGGYNHNPPLVRLVSGPGHFVASDHPSVAGEVVFDYRRIPTAQHPQVPPLTDNEHGLPALVFGDLVDVVRRVSRHVFVGDASKGGEGRVKPMPWIVRIGVRLPTAPFVVVRVPRR
jgi:hypothetical protein